MIRRPAWNLCGGVAGACLCVGAALILGGGTATADGGHPAAYSYHVLDAKLNVFETGKYTSDHPPVKWDGDGHHHETMTPPDPELPPLPVALTTRGTSGVFIGTDVIVDGDETAIDAEGHRESCSGVFSSEDKAGIGVEVKQKGAGTLTTWEIPHHFISPRCGFGYDYLPLQLRDHNKVGGDIGDHRLVLTVDGKLSKTKILSDGTVEHDLRWAGKIVLKRARAL